MAFNHGIVVIRVLKGAPDSDAVESPAPLSVMNDVTNAPLCWLAATSAPGIYTLTAMSSCASTTRATGSLVTEPPAAIVTDASPSNMTGLRSPVEMLAGLLAD